MDNGGDALTRIASLIWPQTYISAKARLPRPPELVAFFMYCLRPASVNVQDADVIQPEVHARFDSTWEMRLSQVHYRR